MSGIISKLCVAKHILIGGTGFYTIETKTFSKPTDHNAKITFDGEVITKDGRRLDRDPVVQARAQASWLSELLEESTGRKCRVRPVVLFPGWFVESGWQEDLWVLNPKGLSGFLDKQEIQLTDEETGIFAYHLSRIVRSS